MSYFFLILLSAKKIGLKNGAMKYEIDFRALILLSLLFCFIRSYVEFPKGSLIIEMALFCMFEFVGNLECDNEKTEQK